MSETKEWTLMFYFASDNPLAPSIVSQLKAIKDAGFHPDANVIAQFDPHVVNTPAHTFDVNLVNKIWAFGRSKVGFDSNDPFVRNLVLDKLWGQNEESIRNRVKAHVEGTHEGSSAKAKGMVYDPPKPSQAMSGEQSPKEALSSFLGFCRQFYPARHYLLFILGHGLVVGNDSFLFDDHAAQHSLLLTELGTVLRTFSSDIQKEHGELEMVSFHSCSMSGLEVAYELEGTAKYMLASQGPAFVGSFPYKQILLRVFNDLNSSLSENDIIGDGSSADASVQRLVNKVRAGEDPVACYLRSKLAPETMAALSQHDPGAQPKPALVSAVVSDINKLLESADMSVAPPFIGTPSSTAMEQLKGEKLELSNLRRLNRCLLADAYPQEITKHPKIDIKRMLTRIFYYCLYNSYDFQLAGYSFDLCLSDLTKVRETSGPIDFLAKSLIAGLKDEKSRARELILLAHWDSQSFWQEDYADLYDFCFRLQKRCLEANPNLNQLPTTETLKAIYDACSQVTEALRRGSENITDKLIVRSAFAGPAFQYSHGLSIFFPWAEPVGSKLWDEQYEEYRLNKNTSWRAFLSAYFELTRRKTHLDEADPKEPVVKGSMSADLLSLLDDIGTHIFNDEGQLEKPGPDHPMGKHGPDDPTGGNCDCPTVKNFPRFTGAHTKFESINGKASRIPVSRTFFEGLQLREDQSA
jgi:hypothetical protein